MKIPFHKILRRRQFVFIVAFLLLPAPLYANPIDISSLPPHPTVLCSLLAEVLVVALLIWRFHLKMFLFILLWYAVNLFSFFLLLQGMFYLASLANPSPSLGISIVILAELIVIGAEGAALYGLSRLPLLQTSASKSISWPVALSTSLLGNITSIVTFPLWTLIPWSKI
jgi:hypothetical protein